jgi:hypothetical protein
VEATVAALAAAPSPRRSVGPTPCPRSPVQATLPYSFEQANFRVTLLDVVADQSRTAIVPSYRFVQLALRFENLLNIRNDSAGCVGFAGVRVKTNQGNIYGPNDAGYDLMGGSLLRPARNQPAGSDSRFRRRSKLSNYGRAADSLPRSSNTVPSP